MEKSQYTLVAIQAALQAGEILKKGFSTDYQITTKPGIQNFVTPYDLAAEKCIINEIKSHFSDHSFLAEESGHSHPEDKERVVWIIDPLDGTLNFSRKIPFFCVNIAAVQGEEVLCGVTYQPITQELFVAQKGFGATLNGKKIQVSSISSFDYTVSVTGFFNFLRKDPALSSEQLLDIISKNNHVRDTGSSALNLAYVASGSFDVYWGTKLSPWDMAAGKLLVEEAGGRVTHIDGSPRSAYTATNILATNGFVHEEAIKILTSGTKSA